MLKWSSRVAIPFVLLLASVGGPQGAASAAADKLGTITEFTVPTTSSAPQAIAAGPDGNLWFGEVTARKIGRITPSGTITEFAIPGLGYPYDITAGPDGNMWFTVGNPGTLGINQSGSKTSFVGRITPSGAITEFATPTPYGSPTSIAAGADGNLWFNELSAPNIGRITPSGTITEYPLPTSPASNVGAGPDGNMWATEFDELARITPSGTVTEFPMPTTLGRLATGPDGNLWSTEGNDVVRINSAGEIEAAFPIPTPYSGPEVIAAGPDGDMWFTEDAFAANNVARITMQGVITEFPVPTATSGPAGIAAGPDAKMWFTEVDAGKIGRITDRPLRELTLTPNSGPPSSKVQAIGSGWGAFEKVTIGFNDSMNGRSVLAKTTTDVNGHFSVEVTIPPNATAGSQSIRVEGHISGLSRRTPFTVT